MKWFSDEEEGEKMQIYVTIVLIFAVGSVILWALNQLLWVVDRVSALIESKGNEKSPR